MRFTFAARGDSVSAERVSVGSLRKNVRVSPHSRSRACDEKGVKLSTGMILGRIERQLATALALVFLAPACTSWNPSDEASTLGVLDAAELALARADWVEAERGFASVLAKDEANARALLGAARVELRERDPEAALALFDRYEIAVEGRSSMRARRERCEALALGAEAALSRLDAARAVDLSERLGDESCEVEHVDRIRAEATLALAGRYRDSGEADRALDLYRSVIPRRPAGKIDPDTDRPSPGTSIDALRTLELRRAGARAYRGAALILRDEGRRGEALALLARGLAELPNDRDLIRLTVEILCDESPP
jgi:tetratricopeptide (TPR) repeat protein